MKRRSAYGLSLLMLSLWMLQTALSESGVLFLSIGVTSLTLAGVGGGILSGAFEPETVPDEEMGTLASRIVLAMLSIGLMAFVLVSLIPYA